MFRLCTTREKLLRSQSSVKVESMVGPSFAYAISDCNSLRLCGASIIWPCKDGMIVGCSSSTACYMMAIACRWHKDDSKNIVFTILLYVELRCKFNVSRMRQCCLDCAGARSGLLAPARDVTLTWMDAVRVQGEWIVSNRRTCPVRSCSLHVHNWTAYATLIDHNWSKRRYRHGPGTSSVLASTTKIFLPFRNDPSTFYDQYLFGVANQNEHHVRVRRMLCSLFTK
jgi:hypothetical protein